MSCCYSISYNVYTHICCDSKVSIRGQSSSCCGNKPYYNSYNHLCCQEKLMQRGNNTHCCGTTPYSSYTHVCCRGSIAPLNMGTSCCGNRPYHEYSHICCNEISRLKVVSRGAKKKQAVRDERVSYLQVAPL